VFDLAVSSYAPTLGALLAPAPAPLELGGLLAVSEESTLSGTKLELSHIQRHAMELRYRQLETDQATPGAVLDAMEQYGSVHLACHASQDTLNPIESCFHLHGGALSLAEIAKKSLKNKGLAFLSACQTATGDEQMPDEAIHLAAGMLVAGYPTVIATMWSIKDGDAPLIADQVYGELMKDGRLDGGRAARALHAAVGALRTRIGVKEFARWVPYVHMGI
jgi:CHAT domain-containing protein